MDDILRRKIARQRELERERLREEERKDLQVEADRGPRPLEGFAGGATSWTSEQDDSVRGLHRFDAELSDAASEDQVRRMDPRLDDEG